MAPKKPIKTYSRKSNIIPLRKPNAVDIFDALFAHNISKRKELQSERNKYKLPFTIKELPAPDENHHLLHDISSLSFNNDDTFDKLRKALPATNVYTKSPVSSFNNNDNIESSKSPDSPKCINVTEPLETEDTSFVKTDNHHECISKDENVLMKPEDLPHLPGHLEESVNESLCIEVINKPSHVVDDLSTLASFERPTSESPTEVPNQNLFSNTFKQANAKNMPITASTPAAVDPCNKMYVLHDDISPILAITEKNSILLESYREIYEWSYITPSFLCSKSSNNNINTNKPKTAPKVKAKFRVKPKAVPRRIFRQPKIVTRSKPPEDEQLNIKDDWKLKIQPVVTLDNALDIIGVGNTIRFDDIRCEGWSLTKIRDSLATSLYIRSICEIYEKCLIARSTNFLSNSKRICRTKSLALTQDSTKSKAALDLNKENFEVELQKEYDPDLSLDGCSFINNNSAASLFSSEESERSNTFSLITKLKSYNTNVSLANVQENGLEEIQDGNMYNHNSLLTLNDSISRSRSSTPIAPSKKQPIQTVFDDSRTAQNIYKNILENLENIVNDHSYACVKPVEDLHSSSSSSSSPSPPPPPPTVESAIIISDDDDDDDDDNDLEGNNSNQSIMIFHNYTKNSNDSIPVIDLTKDSEDISQTSSRDNSRLLAIDTANPSTGLDMSTISYPSNCDSPVGNGEIRDDFSFALPIVPSRNTRQHEVQPGKMWRRSLLNIKKSLASVLPNCSSEQCGLCTCCINCKLKESDQHKSFSNRRISVRVLPEKQKVVDGDTSKSALESYAASYVENAQAEKKEKKKKHQHEKEPIKEHKVIEELPKTIFTKNIKACDIIMGRCEQTKPIPFEELYTPVILRDCTKLGEGVYGEVFEYFNTSTIRTVMKIIPIEGGELVNGEHQKKFEEIISEIIICMELSNLRSNKRNNTSGFSEVYRVRCVKGRYPPKLLELWRQWDQEKHSENDSPVMFKEDQLYIILELAHGGLDMEEYVFKNSVQALSLFKQMAFSLAVAETTLKFEHRDLHWGNVLINTVDYDKPLKFFLDGLEYIVPSYGVQGSIIDFTLSRITYDAVCIYNDLSLDPELFEATGDYQFEIYRLMKNHNGNNWSEFNPYTNVLWLHYTADKMISELHYRNTRSKVHLTSLRKLQHLKKVILDYTSVRELVIGEFFT